MLLKINKIIIIPASAINFIYKIGKNRFVSRDKIMVNDSLPETANGIFVMICICRRLSETEQNMAFVHFPKTFIF